MKNIIVDAMGKQCPVPVVMAKKALEEMTEPGDLEVYADNVSAVQNLLRMAAGAGCEAKSETTGEGKYTVTIAVTEKTLKNRNGQKTEGAAGMPETADCRTDAPAGGTVAVISSSFMGNGDDKLGAVLMKGFLYALSQQEKLPETILFYNGGAFLTTEGSASIDDLKAMEAAGVQILTCGTCLDFYGLKEKLLVGGVTNMYDIVTKMNAAGKVIRP